MYLRELSVSERRSTEPPIAHHSTLEITATVTTANADPTTTVPFLRTHHRQPWHPQALKYLHGYHPQDTLLLNMVQLLVSGDQDPSGAQEVTPEARIMQEDLIWVLDLPIVKEAAAVCGGGGGGRPDMAQAGGKDPSKLEEALRIAEELVLSQANVI